MAKNKNIFKGYFKGESDVFIIGKLMHDIIDWCKLPEAIELRKK